MYILGFLKVSPEFTPTILDHPQVLVMRRVLMPEVSDIMLSFAWCSYVM